jgi:RNA polymerase sigma-70 factor (ECF subfamily)
MAIPVPADLVEAAKDGSPAQMERLLKVAWPDAYRLARSIIGESQGAEDVAQEACIILCRTLTSLRNAAAFRVWFYRIVVREAAEYKRRQPRVEPVTETAAACVDQTSKIDLRRALSALPQRLRAIVVLRYFEDFSSREIASVLRTTDGAVRFHLMIAKRRLRPLLSENPKYSINTASEVRTNAIQF